MIKISSFILYLLTSVFLSIGWLVLYSAANGNIYEWANKQIIFACYAMIFSIILAFIPTQYFFRSSYFFLGLCIIMLLAAEFFGHTAMGAQRWLKIGFITIQPSEITKIGIILSLSRIFSQLKLEEIYKVKNLIIPLAIVFIPASIILKQPNLGTSTIIVFISGAMFFAAGVKIWKFNLVILSVIASMPILWNFLHDYQKRRVMTFLNPEQDLLGDGYNIMQSKIAIGSGGLYGKGFMQGTQVQLNFLPEKHTDFIFTILAEEFGFYGVIAILFLYLSLIYTIYFISLRTKNNYSKLVCAGVANMIFFHIFINIGMISGLLPVVGTPLPLLSYGRSNLITIILSIGLVLNANIYRNYSRVFK